MIDIIISTILVLRWLRIGSMLCLCNLCAICWSGLHKIMCQIIGAFLSFDWVKEFISSYASAYLYMYDDICRHTFVFQMMISIIIQLFSFYYDIHHHTRFVCSWWYLSSHKIYLWRYLSSWHISFLWWYLSSQHSLFFIMISIIIT